MTETKGRSAFTREDLLRCIGNELNVGSVQSLAEDFPQYSRALDDLPRIGAPPRELFAQRVRGRFNGFLDYLGNRIIRYFLGFPPTWK